MLGTIQFPMADVREFLPMDTHRYDSPHWRGCRVVAGKEFVHRVGPMVARNKRGLGCLSFEERFAEAKHALKFGDEFGAKAQSGECSPAPLLECAFRRLFHDGRATVRFEIGLSPRRRTRSALRDGSLSAVDIVTQLLGLNTCVPPAEGERKFAPLVDQRDTLAEHILRATTRSECSDAAMKWWITPGTPIVVLEYRSHEAFQLPRMMEACPFGNAQTEPVYFMTYSRKGLGIPVWLIPETNVGGGHNSRSLRMCLTRLHAERECFWSVIGHLQQQRIMAQRGAEDGDNLQRYLLDTAHFLLRAYSNTAGGDAIDYNEILSTAYRCEAYVGQDERSTIVSTLKDIRPNVAAQVEDLLQREDALNPRAPEQYTIVVEEMTVTNVHDIEHSTVQIVTAEQIQGSFNVIQQSQASPDVKNALTDLTTQVGELCKQLPDDRAAEAAEYLKTIQEQSVRERPVKSLLRTSVDGLKEIASAVTELAEPVSKAISVLLPLVGLVL